jgi:hypothetical protein
MQYSVRFYTRWWYYVLYLIRRYTRDGGLYIDKLDTRTRLPSENNN